MNPLFVNALSSIVFVSDYMEYLDSGKSFIIQTLISLGCPRQEAKKLLLGMGPQQEKAARELLSQIEQQGLIEAFDAWADQDEVINARKEGIILALQIVVEANRTKY